MSVFCLVELAKRKENEVRAADGTSETNTYVNQEKSPLNAAAPNF